MEKDELKIVLPDTKECKKHKVQNSNDPVEWELIWNNVKIDFFKRYTISEELKEKYLTAHSEDKNIINKQVIC